MSSRVKNDPSSLPCHPILFVLTVLSHTDNRMQLVGKPIDCVSSLVIVEIEESVLPGERGRLISTLPGEFSHSSLFLLVPLFQRP